MLHPVKQHLFTLQSVLERYDLWQSMPPAEAAFLSKQPFALDTMSATEWLQWIFIPRMHALIESGSDLPTQMAVSPYLEEALKEHQALADLLTPIIAIEQFVKNV